MGDFDFERTVTAEFSMLAEEAEEEDGMTEFAKTAQLDMESEKENTVSTHDIDIASYKPNVQGREWIISDTDLSWISCGCYILGTGGGGSPYSHMLRLREIMKSGGVVRVVSPDDLQDDARVGCGGGKGSPTVSIEKLSGDE